MKRNLPYERMREALGYSITDDEKEIGLLKQLYDDFLGDEVNHGPNSESFKLIQRALNIITGRRQKEQDEIEEKKSLMSILDKLEELGKFKPLSAFEKDIDLRISPGRYRRGEFVYSCLHCGREGELEWMTEHLRRAHAKNARQVQEALKIMAQEGLRRREYANIMEV